MTIDSIYTIPSWGFYSAGGVKAPPQNNNVFSPIFNFAQVTNSFEAPPLFNFYNYDIMNDFFDKLLMSQVSALTSLKYQSKGGKFNVSSGNAFETALKTTLKFEGGYSNNKNDKGGATNYGITQSSYNSWRKRNGLASQSVKNITQDEVKKIYYNDYWLASGANKASDPKMAVAIFDTAVLHGVGGAKKLLSQSGGTFDGLLQARRDKYSRIVASDSSQKTFYKGWNNRVNQLQQFA